MQLPFAEDVPYFKTGKSTPDTWLDMVEKEILRRDGRVFMRAMGQDQELGVGCYLFVFELEGETFQVKWPVLPTRNANNEYAARRQAATMIYHDVKARCVSAEVLGARTAFFSYLLLPDKRTVADLAAPELMGDLSKLLSPGGG